MLLRLIQLAILLALLLPAWHVQAQQAFGRRRAMRQEPSVSEMFEEFASEPEDKDEIETDRDSFTPAITTAGRGRLISEMAYSFIDNRRVAETHSFPEWIARYGVTDWLETRLGWNYEVGGDGGSVSGSDPGESPEEPGIERESAISYGFKARLLQQQGWRPQCIWIAQAATPTSGRDKDTQLVNTFGFGWQLPNGWKWDSAIRYGLDATQADHFNLWTPSTVLKIPLGEKWNAHVEYFGIFTDGLQRESSRQYFSPGLHYLLTPDLEIGVRVGWGLNDQAASFFSNVGGGWRY